MKPYHETMVQQFMLEGPPPCTILCFNVHTTVEYLNRSVFIGPVDPTHLKIYCGFVHGQGPKS